MDQPRIFISHSARDDADAIALLNDLQAALTQDFAVRVDKDNLELGDDWRNSINAWLGRCDAAVILLSEKALKSHFVAYEASVLTFRRKMAGPENFKVIPVFLKGVDYPTLQANKLFAPTNIQEIQAAIAETDRAQIVARVKEKLLEVRQNLAPVDEQAAYLASLLAPVGVFVVNNCLNILGAAPDPWGQAGDPHLRLALRLIEVGLDKARRAIRVFRSFLTEKVRGEVFELVATSWVDLRSASYISEIVSRQPAERVLALNGDDALLADLYVLRASRLPPGDHWRLAPCDAVVSEQVVEDLKQKVEERLRRVLQLDPQKTLESELDYYERLPEPVFVALPAAGLTRVVLDELRRAFPTVTFFFLAGGSQSIRDVLSTVNVEFIEPPLLDGFEGPFCTMYKEHKEHLNK